jgi:CheY-like chemotaxis protein
MPNRAKSLILIVDGEPHVLESLEAVLMAAGYDVTVAENGVLALLQLSKSLPDLMVSDLNMPKMSGVEFMSQVRRLHPQVSIIAMKSDAFASLRPIVPLENLDLCKRLESKNPAKEEEPSIRQILACLGETAILLLPGTPINHR